MAFAPEDFDLSDENREFRDSLRRFFAEVAPMAEVRRAMEPPAGPPGEAWKRACSELGLAGLAIPEAAGGQGFGLRELAIALGEVGRTLAPVPLFASAALAGRAAAATAPGAAGEEWLAPIAAGAVTTLACAERQGFTLEDVRAEARSGPEGPRLFGEKAYVLAAREAERFFVVARSPGSRGAEGLGLFAVEREAPGLACRPVDALDPTRPLAALHLDSVPARAVGDPQAAGPALARALEEATLLLCAEMTGGMQAVLETAVEYAGARHQFGRAIGSFQAIKHKCADMLIDFEGARTATAAALAAAETDAPERSMLASVAKAHAGPAYVRMATENLQVHGGVGYTWEYDAHLYYRRAVSCEVLLGGPELHHERLARCLSEAAA